MFAGGADCVLEICYYIEIARKNKKKSRISALTDVEYHVIDTAMDISAKKQRNKHPQKSVQIHFWYVTYLIEFCSPPTPR